MTFSHLQLTTVYTNIFVIQYLYAARVPPSSDDVSTPKLSSAVQASNAAGLICARNLHGVPPVHRKLLLKAKARISV